MAHSLMPFNRPVLCVFVLFLSLSLILPGAVGPAYALRKQQVQDSLPAAAQLTAGMEELGTRTAFDPRLLERLDAPTRTLLVEVVIPAIFGPSLWLRGDAERQRHMLEQLKGPEFSVRLDAPGARESLQDLLERWGRSGEGFSFRWDLYRWVNAYLLAPQVVALYADMRNPMVLVDVAGYELYKRQGRSVPRPVLYLPAGAPIFRKGVMGQMLAGNSFVEIDPRTPEMKLVRDEELSHAVDQDVVEKVALIDETTEQLYERHHILANAPVRQLLTIASSGGDTLWTHVLIAEMKAVLRMLRNPYLSDSLSTAEDVLRTVQDSGGNPMAWVLWISMGAPQNDTLLPHIVVAARLADLLQEGQVFRDVRAKAAEQFWAETFSPEEPMDLPMERVYPATDAETESQLDRLAKLAESPAAGMEAGDLIKEWQAFSDQTRQSFQGFHGKLLEYSRLSLRRGHPPKGKRWQRLAMPAGLDGFELGKTIATLNHLFSEFERYVDLLNRGRYDFVSAFLEIRLPAVQGILDNIEQVAKKTRQVEQQELLLGIEQGRLEDYRKAVETLRRGMEAWSGRLSKLPSAPFAAGMEEQISPGAEKEVTGGIAHFRKILLDRRLIPVDAEDPEVAAALFAYWDDWVGERKEPPLIRITPADLKEKEMWQQAGFGLQPLVDDRSLLRLLDPAPLEVPNDLLRKIVPGEEENQLRLPLAAPLNVPGFDKPVGEILLAVPSGTPLPAGFSLEKLRAGTATINDRRGLLAAVHRGLEKGILRVEEPLFPLGLPTLLDKAVFMKATGLHPDQVQSEEERVEVRARTRKGANKKTENGENAAPNKQPRELSEEQVQGLIARFEPRAQAARAELIGFLAEIVPVYQPSAEQTEPLRKRIEAIDPEGIIRSVVKSGAKTEEEVLLTAGVRLKERRDSIEPAIFGLKPQREEEEFVLDCLGRILRVLSDRNWKSVWISHAFNSATPRPFIGLENGTQSVTKPLAAALAETLDSIQETLRADPPEPEGIGKLLREAEALFVAFLSSQGSLSEAAADAFLEDPLALHAEVWISASEAVHPGDPREVAEKTEGADFEESKKWLVYGGLSLLGPKNRFPDHHLRWKVVKNWVTGFRPLVEKETARSSAPQPSDQSVERALESVLGEIQEEPPRRLKRALLLGPAPLREVAERNLYSVGMMISAKVAYRLGFDRLARRLEEIARKNLLSLAADDPSYEPWFPLRERSEAVNIRRNPERQAQLLFLMLNKMKSPEQLEKVIKGWKPAAALPKIFKESTLDPGQERQVRITQEILNGLARIPWLDLPPAPPEINLSDRKVWELLVPSLVSKDTTRLLSLTSTFGRRLSLLLNPAGRNNDIALREESYLSVAEEVLQVAEMTLQKYPSSDPRLPLASMIRLLVDTERMQEDSLAERRGKIIERAQALADRIAVGEWAAPFQQALLAHRHVASHLRLRSRPPAAGAEEADRSALAEIEKILRNPGIQRRVPIRIKEVVLGGARVRYTGAAGGTVAGFLPLGAAFLDDGRLMRMEAKRTWLEERAKRGEPMEAFPEQILTKRDGRVEVIFRLEEPVRGGLFDEEAVFYKQIIATDVPGRVRAFLFWLKEQGRNPFERLIEMYSLDIWGELRPSQEQEILRWLTEHLRPSHARALFLLFDDLLNSWRKKKQGLDERTLATLEQATAGLARASKYLREKEEALEVIQGLYGFVGGWPLGFRERGLFDLRRAAQSLGIPQSEAWLAQVTSAGAEEEKQFGSVEQFLTVYAQGLRSRGLLGRVETMVKERKLPVQVWVIPTASVTQQAVRVYVLAGSSDQQTEWEVAVLERLNREGSRLERVLFSVEPYPVDGKIQMDLPAVVIRQMGSVMPMHPRPVVPRVTVSLLNEVEMLVPSWVYSLAINQKLRATELGPLLEAVPVEDGFALFV